MLLRGARDVSRLADGDEEAKTGEIEVVHGTDGM